MLQILNTALVALRRNVTRSLLKMLGIVIGIAAVITLIRENGRIYSSVSFGSPKYEEFDAYLKAHAGEELVFLYIGHAEVVLSHDSYYTQGDFDVSPLFGEIASPFEHFRSDEAVYVP